MRVRRGLAAVVVVVAVLEVLPASNGAAAAESSDLPSGVSIDFMTDRGYEVSASMGDGPLRGDRSTNLSLHAFKLTRSGRVQRAYTEHGSAIVKDRYRSDHFAGTGRAVGKIRTRREVTRHELVDGRWKTTASKVRWSVSSIDVRWRPAGPIEPHFGYFSVCFFICVPAAYAGSHRRIAVTGSIRFGASGMTVGLSSHRAIEWIVTRPPGTD